MRLHSSRAAQPPARPRPWLCPGCQARYTHGANPDAGKAAKGTGRGVLCSRCAREAAS